MVLSLAHSLNYYTILYRGKCSTQNETTWMQFVPYPSKHKRMTQKSGCSKAKIEMYYGEIDRDTD